MNGPELLKALMDAAGENAYGIATSLKKPPLQSYIWKFINGKAKEPRRSSLRPIADYYGVPLEAFYDPTLADQVAVERGLAQGVPAVEKAEPLKRASRLAEALDVLAEALQNAGRDELLAVERWLSAMAADPANAKNKSELILKLLVTSGDKLNKPRQDRMRQSHIVGELGVLDLGDNHDGRRDTNATAAFKKR